MARGQLIFILYFALNVLGVECFKILGICSLGYPSHNAFCRKLLTSLAKSGHEITMITFVPLPSPVDNITEILLQQNEEQQHPVDGEELVSFAQRNILSLTKYASDVGLSISKSVLGNSKFQNIMQSKQEFDLVMMEMLYSQALVGIINRFKCPLILFTPLLTSNWIDQLNGNEAPLAYSPTLHTKYSQYMSFLERLANVGYNLLYQVYIQYFHLPRQYEIYKKYFPDAPHLQKLIRNNISLFLVNSNPAILGGIPSVPAIVGIAGIHINEQEELARDLQEIMNNARNGVIYFSLGSIVGSNDLPPKVLDAILKSLSKRKETVLWKFENNGIVQNIPRNVIIKNWFPQHSVLAHPNLKVFITHGGANSLIEAVYSGVPLLGMPVIADQLFNIAVAQDKGFAIQLDLFHITEEIFTAKLKNIIEDPKYRESAKIHSKAFRDQLVKPTDALVFWTEYVVRNNGARHLRTPALDLHWTQIYLLDIAAFLVITALLIIFLLNILIRICLSWRNNIARKIKKE